MSIPMRPVTGNPLLPENGEPGDFVIHDERLATFNKGHIEFICPNRRACLVPIRLGDPKPGDTGPHRWGYDGNRNAPTLVPSIHCNGRGGCGWHGHMSSGKLTNV